MVKIQVKYARLKKNGVADVKCNTSWADKNGTHSRRYKKSDFDYYAIYCPEKEKVVYIPNSLNSPKVVRFEKPTNNQRKHVRWANNFFDF